MKLKTLFFTIPALLLFLAPPLSAQTRAELKKITASVYSYVDVHSGTPGDAFSANAGIIIGEKGVLVVDTLTSAKEAEAFMADIRKITDKPILYVVNTHYHLDHALGNSFFADIGAHIISQSKCREAIITKGKNVLANPAGYGLPTDFWQETRIAPPDITFENAMSIDLGGITARLIYTGKSSHTSGSIMVHVPEQNVIFTGDILFTDYHPFLAEGDFPGWQKNLDFLLTMNVKNIIPGHGPLSSNKDVQNMKTYLTVFDKKATELSVGEKDIEKLTKAMLQVIPQCSDGAFLIPMNLQYRYLPQQEKAHSK